MLHWLSPLLVAACLTRAYCKATPLATSTVLTLQAAREGNTRALELLLVPDVGKRLVKRTDNEGMTALHWAAYEGQTAAATVLLQHSAKVDPRTSLLQMTPLMFACDRGFSLIAELLLHAGANIDAAVRHELDDAQIAVGTTSLMLAAAKGEVAVVRTLLAAGASQNQRDIHGTDASGYAHRGGHAELAATLQSPKQRPNAHQWPLSMVLFTMATLMATMLIAIPKIVRLSGREVPSQEGVLEERAVGRRGRQARSRARAAQTVGSQPLPPGQGTRAKQRQSAGTADSLTTAAPVTPAAVTSAARTATATPAAVASAVAAVGVASAAARTKTAVSKTAAAKTAVSRTATAKTAALMATKPAETPCDVTKAVEVPAAEKVLAQAPEPAAESIPALMATPALSRADTAVREASAATTTPLLALATPSDGEGDQSCIICLDADRTHALVPCGHLCVCADCAERIPVHSKCPLCREAWITSLRIYHP